GKTDALRTLAAGLLADGHVLLEDLPGLGKTLIAKCFASALGLTFQRVQFTADLMPTDITGGEVYDPGTGKFSFRRGPVFTQV
ncbi:ATPase associated with various cellular activities, AAA-3 domain protein, partial [mine drainage metagenome]